MRVSNQRAKALADCSEAWEPCVADIKAMSIAMQVKEAKHSNQCISELALDLLDARARIAELEAVIRAAKKHYRHVAGPSALPLSGMWAILNKVKVKEEE